MFVYFFPKLFHIYKKKILTLKLSSGNKNGSLAYNYTGFYPANSIVTSFQEN